MIKHSFLIVFFFISNLFFAQIKTDSIKNEKFIVLDGDTISMLRDTVFLEEVQINKEKLDPEAQKQFLLLQNRVYKVYPY